MSLSDKNTLIKLSIEKANQALTEESKYFVNKISNHIKEEG